MAEFAAADILQIKETLPNTWTNVKTLAAGDVMFQYSYSQHQIAKAGLAAEVAAAGTTLVTDVHPEFVFADADWPGGLKTPEDMRAEIASKNWVIVKGVGFLVIAAQVAAFETNFGSAVQRLSEMPNGADPFGFIRRSPVRYRVMRSSTVLWSTDDAEDRDGTVTDEVNVTGGVAVAGK